MAVAVKTVPDTRSGGTPPSPALLSLIGLVYLLACLAILFKLVPDLWWLGWESAGLTRYKTIGGTLLVLVALVAAYVLLRVGGQLLGAKPPVGVRAGIVVAFFGLVFILLLARWVSLWAEYWSYSQNLLSESAALALTCGVAGALLLGGMVLFFLPATKRFLVTLEEMGWFHATSYKGNQGQKVRRGTIFGILLIVGSGVYTLIANGTLTRGNPDWSIDIPFTGSVGIDSYGDSKSFLTAALAESDQVQVEIRYPGTSAFRVGQVVSFPVYRAAVEEAARGDERLQQTLNQALPEPNKVDAATFLDTLGRKVVGPRIEQLLAGANFNDLTTKEIESRYNETNWEDLSQVLVSIQKANGTPPRVKLGKELELPVAVLYVDRYLVRKINEQAESSQNVKIRVPGDTSFKYGEIVSREKFDEAVAKLKSEPGASLPKEASLEPLRGTTRFAAVTLLPAVQFTVPLLLIAASLWLAWRVVNLPAFADFLIATEAELNKVSWTTQKRLFQDTIVVLVTVFLMAVFLFGMDYTWKVVLSNWPIQVVYIPPQDGTTNKKVEDKPW